MNIFFFSLKPLIIDICYTFQPHQLIIEAAVGVAVIVRVFADKKRMETEIVNRLGSGFSRAPLAAVVVSIRCFLA